MKHKAIDVIAWVLEYPENRRFSFGGITNKINDSGILYFKDNGWKREESLIASDLFGLPNLEKIV